MKYPPAIKNITARRLLRALERDGFTCTTRRKGTLLYRHSDGRRVEVHFHSSGQTFPMGTLRAMLEDAGWAVEDLKRLGLVSRRDP
jgi:predicted RNA binding protein YcfA (HicA-like mRNA interferase family)